MTDWLDIIMARMTRTATQAVRSQRLGRILREAWELKERLAELEPNHDQLEAMISAALAEALVILGPRASKYAPLFRRARTSADAGRPPES